MSNNDATSSRQALLLKLKTRDKPKDYPAHVYVPVLALINIALIALSSLETPLLTLAQALDWMFVINILALMFAGFIAINRAFWSLFGDTATVLNQVLELAVMFVWLMAVFAIIAVTA
ncbi:hypothetical protein L2D00_10035 [Hyphomonadaceae bacterium BL14]|nr:hypothetical protein L2D00_10035 [Hyphomonadaceae bacterium BL14]